MRPPSLQPCPICGGHRLPIEWCFKCGPEQHPELARLKAALEKAQPCVLALRDTQRAMGHDYVCDDVVNMIAAVFKEVNDGEG